jgi:hypothetical protein
MDPLRCIEYSKQIAFVFTFFLIAIFFESCSSSFTLKPFRPQFTIKIMPPIIQTSDYQYFEIPIDSLSSLALQRDFVEIEDSTSWNIHFLTSFQNPFRVIAKNENQSTCFSVKIVVERVAYEPTIVVRNYLAYYPLLGFALASKTANSNSMAAYVQYRYFITDSTGITIDSFVVITASSGSPQSSSRKQLLDEAHLLAAAQFSNILVSRLNNIGRIKVHSQTIDYEYPAKRRLRYLKMMKLMISDSQKR